MRAKKRCEWCDDEPHEFACDPRDVTNRELRLLNERVAELEEQLKSLWRRCDRGGGTECEH